MSKHSGSADPKHQTPSERQAPGLNWAPLTTLHAEIDRLFDDFSGGFWLGPRARRVDPDAVFTAMPLLAPVVELVDCRDHYAIKAELPGLAPEEIDLQIADGMLTISGKKSAEQHDEKAGYLMSERRYGAFQRSLRLPPVADTDKIDATLSQGILTVTIPKSAKARETARKIAINPS